MYPIVILRTGFWADCTVKTTKTSSLEVSCRTQAQSGQSAQQFTHSIIDLDKGDVGQILVFISVTIYVVGSVSYYSSDLWPRGVGPRGSTLHLAGSREGAAGGPRPPVRPQPPGAPPPQVVWEWIDAEKLTALLQYPSATTMIRSHMPKNGEKL